MSNSPQPRNHRRASDEADQPARRARPGAPLRRALDDLASTSNALDKARSALRAEEEGRLSARKRNADHIRDLRRKLHLSEREMDHVRSHVISEKLQREESEDRELIALRRADDAERSFRESQEELEHLRDRDQEATGRMAAKIERMGDDLAGAQTRVQQTEAAHKTIRGRVVSLELELGEARTRAVRITESRDEERKARGTAEADIHRLERELGDSLDRSEQLIRTVDIASRIERGLQRYADKKEVQLSSAEQLLIEAHHRLERIGADIQTTRRRVGISPRRSNLSDESRANHG